VRERNREGENTEKGRKKKKREWSNSGPPVSTALPRVRDFKVERKKETERRNLSKKEKKKMQGRRYQ